MKKFLFGMPVVAMVVMVSVFCSCGNKGNVNQVEDAADSVAVESTGIAPVAAKEFIESMYKDFYEPYNNERTEKILLSKYFTKEAMQKFNVESDYEEGDFFYSTDFLINGSISGDAAPDYGDKVVSRTIEPEEDGWFLVTNIWDVIKKPVKVHLQVKHVDGAYKIVDLSEDKEENSGESGVNGDSSSDPVVGKIYKGSGNGGGINTEIIISFLENHQCTCVSDWYQTYSSPKSIKGNYEVKNNQVVVSCKDNDGTEYKFEFDIKSNGRVIEFNHSDPEMGGTMGNDFMSLEIQ